MDHSKQAGLEQFRDIVSGPAENINLAGAALLIAKREYAELDPALYLRRIDGLADLCRARVEHEATPARIVGAMNRTLFDELGFRGDLRTFNDPRNSFLNEVLDRRQGIPISLSVIYIEIGRRLGLLVRGVSFPGHFLVKVDDRGTERVLDPFGGGRELDRPELERRLEHVYGARGGHAPLEIRLRAADNREILARMLRNLKGVYLNAEDYHRALDAVNMILCIHPDAAGEIRDRAHIHDQLRHLRDAIRDYEQYLMLAPKSGDQQHVCMRLAALKQSVGRLH